MLTDFQNSFTIGLGSKRVMKWSLKTHHTSYTSLHYLVKCKCQEISDNLKDMSHIAINFNFILMIILIFVTVNIHNILLWLNAGMEMPGPMVSNILNNALFHSSPCINQTLHQILHVLHFCTLDSLLKYDPYFVVNWIEVKSVWRPQIWKFIGWPLRLLHFWNGGSKWCTNCLGKHSMRKRTQPEKSTKTDTVVLRGYRN